MLEMLGQYISKSMVDTPSLHMEGRGSKKTAVLSGLITMMLN